MNNPFSLSFGKEPQSLINRDSQNEEIIESFLSENPSYQACMLTGVRGSGKTVELTSLSNFFRKEKDWLVFDLNPERDLLNSFAAQLSNRKECLEIFKDAKINLSFLGLGIEIDDIPPITDVVVAVDRMLNSMVKKGKKILITIDEVSSNQSTKEFISEFQIWIRKNYSVFLLMSGLYDNIDNLQNQKALTFLYRALKIHLKPLNIGMISKNYQEIFHLDSTEALTMAKVTMGYPFAYQVLGYLCFKENKKWNEVLPEFDMYLEEYVYEKIWDELSEKDKDILFAMTNISYKKVEEIRKQCGLNSNNFTVYRKRLLKKGIVYAPSYGYLDFSLPRFDEFVRRNRF